VRGLQAAQFNFSKIVQLGNCKRISTKERLGELQLLVDEMKHETIDGGGLSYAPCRYGMSRIFFILQMIFTVLHR
jgi:hypothetical protein